jgi:serine/threonine protein kinase
MPMLEERGSKITFCQEFHLSEVPAEIAGFTVDRTIEPRSGECGHVLRVTHEDRPLALKITALPENRSDRLFRLIGGGRGHGEKPPGKLRRKDSIWRALEENVKAKLCNRDYPTEPQQRHVWDRLIRWVAREVNVLRAMTQVKGASACIACPPDLSDISDGCETLNGILFLYFTMSWVEGTPLELAIKDSTNFQLWHLFLDCVRPFTYLHRANVAYRDIHQGNFMVNPEGRVVLLDLGLVKHRDEPRSTYEKRSHARGTGRYMPEDATPGLYDPKVDVWALGVLGLEILTRRNDFDTEQLRVCHDAKELNGLVQQLAEGCRPGEVAALTRCIALPYQRIKSAVELYEFLQWPGELSQGPNAIWGGLSQGRPDLRLMSWGDGSGVPTSGQNLVIAGLDINRLLHIRTFDPAGDRTDNSETTDISGTLAALDLESADASIARVSYEPESDMSADQSSAIEALKRQLPGLLPPHVLSSAEREQVLSEVTSIIGHTRRGPDAIWDLVLGYQVFCITRTPHGSTYDGVSERDWRTRTVFHVGIVSKFRRRRTIGTIRRRLRKYRDIANWTDLHGGFIGASHCCTGGVRLKELLEDKRINPDTNKWTDLFFEWLLRNVRRMSDVFQATLPIGIAPVLDEHAIQFPATFIEIHKALHDKKKQSKESKLTALMRKRMDRIGLLQGKPCKKVKDRSVIVVEAVNALNGLCDVLDLYFTAEKNKLRSVLPETH